MMLKVYVNTLYQYTQMVLIYHIFITQIIIYVIFTIAILDKSIYKVGYCCYTIT
jgi:hypothetical protein